MASGSGTIRKDDKKGGWVVSIYIRGVRQRRRARTYGEAQAKLRELRRRRQEVETGATGRVGQNPHLTYWELVAAMRAHWQRAGSPGYADKTLESYRPHLNAIEQAWGPRRVADTREVDVRRVAEEMRAAGRATATIAHRLNLLRRLHRLAVEEGLLSREPCSIKPPRVERGAGVDPLPEEELGRLIERARSLGEQELALVLLMADAGLRRAEPPLLRGDHLALLDSDEGYGRLTVPVPDQRRVQRGWRPRQVPILTARLSDALEALDPQPGQRLLSIAGDTDQVVKALTPVWRPVLGGRPRLHRLRDRYGTYWAAKLRSLGTLAEWMGHREISTTERYFRHVGVDAPAGLKE